jgi:hypothetical protein
MNYSIKVSRDSRQEFDNLVVWLCNNDNPIIPNDIANPTPLHLTYAVICYKQSIQDKLKVNDGDADSICNNMLEEFKDDFEIVTRNILKVADFDTMQQMYEIVELFILGYVYSLTDED